MVFESLGVPWPKHDCRTSVVQKYLDYKIDSRFSPSYRFPVPESAEFNRPKDGAVLSGIIVDVLDPRQHVRHPGFFQDIVIYDGNQLFRVQLSHPEKLYLLFQIRIGGYISGCVEYVKDLGAVLLKIKLQPFPPIAAEEQKEKGDLDDLPSDKNST